MGSLRFSWTWERCHYQSEARREAEKLPVDSRCGQPRQERDGDSGPHVDGTMWTRGVMLRVGAGCESRGEWNVGGGTVLGPRNDDSVDGSVTKQVGGMHVFSKEQSETRVGHDQTYLAVASGTRETQRPREAWIEQ